MFIIEDIKTFVFNNVGFIVVVLLLFCGLCFYVLHDNGSGIKPIDQQLRQVERNQQGITDGINNAEKSADNITNGIGTVIERTDNVSDKIAESNRIIEQCESIVEAVRKRHKAEN